MSRGARCAAKGETRPSVAALLTQAMTLLATAHREAAEARRRAANLAPADSGSVRRGDDKPHKARGWRLRARSGAAELLLLQLAAVIAVSAIVVPQLVRVQRAVADLTAEARALEVSVAERQRLNSAVGALARNVTVPPRCANPPSDPDPSASPSRVPVPSADCAVWDPTPRRPTLWEQPGRANTLNGAVPEKELCFVADAQAGSDSPSTPSSGRWLSVLKCVEWHRPAVYGYADSTANSDSPGTLVIADYPQAVSFDPAAPTFDNCAAPGTTAGCNRIVFDGITAFRAYWLSSDGEWRHQPARLPNGSSGSVISPSEAATPHNGTEIVRMQMYMCPQNPYRSRTPDNAPVNHGGAAIAPSGASACARALLTNDPQSLAVADWDPSHADWSGFESSPDELEDDLAGIGATGVWRFELSF